jgi:hypothetical protein
MVFTWIEAVHRRMVAGFNHSMTSHQKLLIGKLTICHDSRALALPIGINSNAQNIALW